MGMIAATGDGTRGLPAASPQPHTRLKPRRLLIGALMGVLALLLMGTNVLALDATQDAGNMFSPQARQTATDKINQIQRDTGKTVLVRTVPSLNGQDSLAAADQTFQQANVNGVLIFASKADQKLVIKVGDNTRSLISQSEEAAIRDQITTAFRSNKFDDGLLAGIDRIGNDLRVGTRTNSGTPRTAPAPATKQSGGFPWLLIIIILAIGIGLAIFLARRASRRAPSPIGGGGYSGGPGPSYGQNYGPGNGPNYGGGGGGGFGKSVIGGAVGGIGGAILGNAIYDHFRDHDDDNRGNNGDYGSVESGNDYGQTSDSPADVGSWGSGDSGSAGDWGSSDPGSAGDWGSSDSGGDFGGGDSGGSSDSSW